MQDELNGVIAGLDKFIREQIDPSTSPTIALIGFKDDVKVLVFTKARVGWSERQRTPTTL